MDWLNGPGFLTLYGGLNPLKNVFVRNPIGARDIEI
jgi:hypothetical protein